MTTGIYKITSPSGKIYIGQSRNIKERWLDYRDTSCKSQIKLHNSLKKYGWKTHKFEIICECLLEELDQKEKHYISFYKTFNTPHGLNLMDGGANGTHSLETREKLRKSHIGKKLSEAAREKVSQSLIGNKRSLGYKHSEETIKKISVASKGRRATPETIARIRNLYLGKKLSEEHKKKLSLAKLGKKKSPEHAKNMGLSRLGKPRSEETKRKISLAHIGMRHSLESRKKISEYQQNKWKGRKDSEKKL